MARTLDAAVITLDTEVKIGAPTFSEDVRRSQKTLTETRDPLDAARQTQEQTQIPIPSFTAFRARGYPTSGESQDQRLSIRGVSMECEISLGSVSLALWFSAVPLKSGSLKSDIKLGVEIDLGNITKT